MRPSVTDQNGTGIDVIISKAEAGAQRLRMPVKISFTLFMLVLVPVYWSSYGPANFLFFCDVALFLTLYALWTENRFVTSLAAVGIVLPQCLWLVDYVARMAGVELLGMTEYMFRESIPLLTRSLSLFHGWLPILLLWMLYRIGYDSRALIVYCLIAWCLILVSYNFLPAPPRLVDQPNAPVNINYVFGISRDQPQTWMHPHLWVATLMAGLPLLVYWPSHLLFSRWFKAGEGMYRGSATGMRSSE